MWVIKGQPGKDVCDKHAGVTRRDVLRVGGAGMLGLTLGGLLRAAGPSRRICRRRRSRLGQGQERHPGLPAGRTQSHRHVGSQARRAGEGAQCLPADLDQDPGRTVHGDPAASWRR